MAVVTMDADGWLSINSLSIKFSNVVGQSTSIEFSLIWIVTIYVVLKN